MRERFRDTYKSFNDLNEVYERLQRLDLDTCSSKDVDTIIGNKSWTNMWCYECGENTDWLLQLGDDPPVDNEGSTVFICKTCAVLVGHQINKP